MGIETEYNIYSDDNNLDAGDAVNLMINVIKKEPLGFDKRSATPTRCFLANGGLLYKDVGAPEYCTPECSNPRDIVIFDRAGEIIVQELARKVSVLKECRIAIYKKNSDGFGNTSGCHDNYSISPTLFDNLIKNEEIDESINTWATFLAIRQVFIGSGKIGSEFSEMPCQFQMTQRADFIQYLRNNLTLIDRPIIQCRDEPLAKGKFVKRLHVICGDANLCESATFLKMGLTSLMLMALEDGYFNGKSVPIFTNSIPMMFKIISRDINLDWQYEVKMTESGRELTMTLTEIVACYLSVLKSYISEIRSSFSRVDDGIGYDQVIKLASSTLLLLDKKKFESLIGVCDWVTKLFLLKQFLSKKSLSIRDIHPGSELELELRTLIDMGYANMDQSLSVYAKLVSKNIIKKIVSNDEVSRALISPPSHGRASQRVKIINKFKDDIKNIDWNKVVLYGSDKEFKFEFRSPIGYNDLVFNSAIESSATVEDFFLAWQSFYE